MHVVSSTPQAVVRRLRRIGSMADVEKVTSLRRSTIYNLVRQGKFPRPIQLTPRRIGFDMEAVDTWIQQRFDEVPAEAHEVTP